MKMVQTWRHIALIALLLPMLAVAQMSMACPTLSPRNTSAIRITDLRPTDVKIFMTMGDSFAVGFAMISTGTENVWTNSVGKTFSSGGDAGAVTIPNLFKYYNPDVTGFSVGTASASICYGSNCPAASYYTSDDGTNAAKPGALLTDMASSQMDMLIRTVNQRPDMDVLNDWKVLTMLVAPIDDLCVSCTFNQTYLTPDDYEGTMMTTLERVRNTLPRTFVNLVASYNMSAAYDVSLRAPHCANATRYAFVECDCLFEPANDDVREMFDDLVNEYNARAVKIANYYAGKAYDNFAVVVQPFLTQTNLAGLPAEFLTDVDCFHPSDIAHEAMATALWNNMLTPAMFKQSYLNMADTVICPTEDSLLYTF